MHASRACTGFVRVPPGVPKAASAAGCKPNTLTTAMFLGVVNEVLR